MTFLLDTSALSALVRGDERTSNWLAAVGPDDRTIICTVVWGEVLFGVFRLSPGKRRQQLETRVAEVLLTLPCEPVPASAGNWYAAIKSAQQRRGLSIDENDLWIAATACALGATLVSNDSDFQRIENLNVVLP